MKVKSKDLQKQPVSRSPARVKNASILIITLWSICLLTVFAVYLGYGTRQKITLIKRIDQRSRLRSIAEAGIKRAVIGIQEEEVKSYDALNDPWSNNPTVFMGVPVEDGSFSVSYEYENEKSNLPEIRYGLIDEQGKININKAGLKVLQRLLITVLGLNETDSSELAASIIDWRDSDSQLSIPLGSAEDRYYRNLQYPYEAKDSEFEVLEELLLVKGMAKDKFDRLKNYITIYGNGKVNINTAGKVAFLSLGLSARIAEGIISLRGGEDAVTGNGDDSVFSSHANIVPKVSQYLLLSGSEVAQLSLVADRYLTTQSEYFMARSVANLNNRKETTEAIGVINREGEILYWKEL